MSKKKKLKPYELDAAMDILNVSKAESLEDMQIRPAANGAVTGPPLTWAALGLDGGINPIQGEPLNV